MQLPDFPWDSLREAKAVAVAHPEGLIDLSVGSPVDPTISSAATALANATNAPGYPATAGSADVVSAMVTWWRTERMATSVGEENVLPVIGSKETVALLPFLLGVGSTDAVVHPTIAYPTYQVGAMVCGASAVASDDPEKWPDKTAVVWINSPSNPTGAMLDTEALGRIVARARQLGAVVVSDECYGLLGSENQPVAPSILSDEVTNGDYSGLLALHSLSKQANMAGYRAAFLAGDSALIDTLLQARRHLGLMVPEPIQAAVAAALSDTDSVVIQREMYTQRRRLIRGAFEAAGWDIEHSEAGLYLWATRRQPADVSVMELAKRGLLVTPGYFYGEAGSHHIRISLTVSDERAAAVSGRLGV